ncbi:hypothetical protein SAY86_027594 [Trapa natans]|uniref:Fe2OG dioxygenase domain-containing protein n=1 Tax=Trapa natans TaxID=22666 RepID=A0AAN7QJC2_TRANT|nr:hypothetical protein SAY86_027594 [Trapa natans]
MLVAMRSLFDLPDETKSRYQNPKPYRSYNGKCSVVPLHESFGIDDPHRLSTARDFTHLMWPHGNPSFCEALHTASSNMLELSSLIMRMILESFGMGAEFQSHIHESSTVFRLMKYLVPPPFQNTGGGTLGMVAHTDKNDITILCQNDVQGLEFIPRDAQDKWVRVRVPEDAFIVIVGDSLKAWSNGRLHAVKHRVVMRGNRERYSWGLFSIPKEGAMIRVPTELIDTDHPLRYRPFKFSDYMSYYVSNIRDDALEVYASI